VKRTFYAALGVVLGVVARVLLATVRVTVEIDPALDAGDPRPWILCFWHGEQIPLLLWQRRRATVALVSHSLDGEMQSRALPRFGLLVERGSTSRGGARGLAAIVRKLRSGNDAAFALDGPRGPRFSVAPGASLAARLAGGVLVPMGSAAPRGVTLEKAWDKLRIPFPFARVAVRLGPPLEPWATADALALEVARASALASNAARMLASHENAVLRRPRRA
jgi:lysophospholipid acyltransferase (LPLAT)-like uncharacterized protein